MNLRAWTIGLALGSAVGCSSSLDTSANAQQSVQTDLVKLATEILSQVDAASNRGKALAASEAALAETKMLPEAKCPALFEERFNLGTEAIKRSTQAGFDLTNADVDFKLLSAKLQGRQDDSLRPTDFDANQPLGELAEKLVKVQILQESATSDSYIVQEIRVRTVFESCVDEEYQKAANDVEVKRNRALVAMITSERSRIAALMSRVDLRPLLEAKTKHAKSLDEARRANADAVKARAKAEAISKALETTDLLNSRKEVNAALATVPRPK